MKASLTLADVQFFMWDADVAQLDRAKDLCARTCKGLFTSREGQPTLMEAAFSTNQALSCRCCDAYCVLVIWLLVLMLNVPAASLSFKLRWDAIIAMTIMCMWQPQIVCGLLDFLLTALCTPTTQLEADLLIALLHLLLLLATNKILAQPGYQGVRSRIIMFCFDYLHHTPPGYFLEHFDSNNQLQLVLLIVIAFQACSRNCSWELQRCAAHQQWLASVGMHSLSLVC